MSILTGLFPPTSGKTTTMSILTGLFPPTSGTATVNGHSILTNMDEIRTLSFFCSHGFYFLSPRENHDHVHPDWPVPSDLWYGHRKTTTMSILTGLFPPTSGTATVNGHSILTSMDEIRTLSFFCSHGFYFFSLREDHDHVHPDWPVPPDLWYGDRKTTTMSILTGLFPPTSGTATVNGHSILTSMDEIRTLSFFCSHGFYFFSLREDHDHVHPDWPVPPDLWYGHRKTTTMSILTGLFPPTSGTATVNGHSILTNMDEIRSSLGLCPQHNILFDRLTVREHLYFAITLKGKTGDEAKREIAQMLQDLQLENKASTVSAQLSGGMKRKLSCSMALIDSSQVVILDEPMAGGSQVVILDEPTAGMDPYARRATWDLLLKYKENRTMLLTYE
ncbi:ABCA4 [Branchiostoma lanceolatum]|uniref:ABCA4 protein n=1 Tax=Branchiostoma lanceolatum TaxID=7740 RepID=A0A8K0F1R0_BRALA|nr:ABCA4 [Branchiostoma lanceolatum]